MSTKFHKLIYYFITLLITGFVLIMFVIYPGINNDKHSMFADMIYGKASKPFVYRTLLPTTVRVLSAAVPQRIKNSLAKKIEKTGTLSKLFSKLKWEKEYAVEYSFAMLLMFLSLWGFALAVRKYFTMFYHAPPWFAGSVSVLALLGLPPMFQYTSFLYDFPLLFLYTLGLIFLFRQDWKNFMLFFLIGCFNKETTILLTLIFYIYYRKKLNREIFNKLIAAQLAVFIVVKSLLFIVFKNNPGTFVEFHLIDHNLRLLTGYDLTLAVSLLGIILLVFYKWKEKPEYIKISLWAFVPLIALTLFLGYIDELRDYYEIYPSVIVLVSVSIADIVGLDIRKLKAL